MANGNNPRDRRRGRSGRNTNPGGPSRGQASGFDRAEREVGSGRGRTSNGSSGSARTGSVEQGRRSRGGNTGRGGRPRPEDLRERTRGRGNTSGSSGSSGGRTGRSGSVSVREELGRARRAAGEAAREGVRRAGQGAANLRDRATGGGRSAAASRAAGQAEQAAGQASGRAGGFLQRQGLRGVGRIGRMTSGGLLFEGLVPSTTGSSDTHRGAFENGEISEEEFRERMGADPDTPIEEVLAQADATAAAQEETFANDEAPIRDVPGDFSVPDERQPGGNSRGVGQATPRRQVQAPGVSEGTERSFTNVNQNTDEPVRTTLRRENDEGGFGEISFDQAAQDRVRERLGTEGNTGTMSVVSGDNLASVPPSQRAELRRARREAAERGDFEAVERSFMTAQERQAADERSRLRRDANARLSGSMTPSEFRRAQLRRQRGREGLADLNERQQEAADNQLERQELAQQRQQNRFENELAAREDRRAQIEQDRELTQQQRENRRENLDRAFERIETLSEGPDGEVDTQRRNQLSTFVSNLPAEDLGPQAADRGMELFETMEALNDEAEVSSELTGLEQAGLIGSGLTLGGAGLAGAFALARRGRLKQAGSTAAAGAVGAGELFRRAGQDGADFPDFDSPEETLSALQELKEKGVTTQNRGRRGSNFGFENRVVEWRGQEVNLGELPPEIQQRLARAVELAPGPGEQNQGQGLRRGQ